MSRSATFFRLLDNEENKGAALQRAISAIANGITDSKSFVVCPQSFSQIPGSPFAYWVSDGLRGLFRKLRRFENNERTVKQGLATADDFRFVRATWEVPPELPSSGSEACSCSSWIPFAKGGAYSPIYADVYLVVNWAHDGAEIKNNLNEKGDIRSNVWMLKDTARHYFLRPGLTWPRRTTSGLSVRVMPGGCVFADKGPAAFVMNNDLQLLLALLAVMNSTAFKTLLSLQLAAADAAARSYEVGLIQSTPIPEIPLEDRNYLAQAMRKAWTLKRMPDKTLETSKAFTVPALLKCRGSTLSARAEQWNAELTRCAKELSTIDRNIERLCSGLYGLMDADISFMLKEHMNQSSTSDSTDGIDEESEVICSPAILTTSLLSWAVGVLFGRFDVRLAVRQHLLPVDPEPFDPPAACSPGMLVSPGGFPPKPDLIASEEWLQARADANTLSQNSPISNPKILDADYPIRICWDGILVDDLGFHGSQPHQDDITHRIREVLELLWKDAVQDIEEETCNILGISDLRDHFHRTTGFFQDHLRRYSKSRRKAPIYWSLATPSSTYAVWLYYHSLTKETFYKVLNDYVDPKHKEEERRLMGLRQDAGPNPTAGQRKEIAAQESFLDELRTFRDEVARIAPLWNPDLNDGVIINFALLWRLVPQHRQWQKECKDCWDKLVKGEYDWAHLAMHLWPERVIPKCAVDRSLAIAHGLEEALWAEGEDGKWRPKKISTDELDKLIREGTSPTVKAALNDLLTAPSQSARSAGSSGTRRRRTTRS